MSITYREAYDNLKKGTGGPETHDKALEALDVVATMEENLIAREEELAKRYYREKK